MATVTYLNYYANGMWNRKKVRSFENNKVTLGSNDPEVDSFPQVKKTVGHRLMSYELGVAPFFLICGGKIWIDSKKEPIFDSKGTRILFARATKNGLIFIHKGNPYSAKLLLCSVSLDGNAVRIGNDVPLSLTSLTKFAPFQSFNPTTSKFHSLNDISSTNLPIGSRILPVPPYETELYLIGTEVLLPPIVINEDDWRDKKNPMNQEYKLNHFSKDISAKVVIRRNGRLATKHSFRLKQYLQADSFWFTEEPIVVNRETHYQRYD